MGRKSRAEILREKRERRKTLTGGDILTMKEEDKKPGYQYRFVNDKDGEVQKFKNAGWDIVSGQVETRDLKTGDAPQEDSVVRRPVGGNTHAVLMQIENELYEEDMQAEEEKRAEKASVIDKFLKRDTGIDVELPVEVGK